MAFQLIGGESLDLGDFRKLTASLTHLFANLGNLPDGKVKAEPKPAEAPAAEEEPQADAPAAETQPAA